LPFGSAASGVHQAGFGILGFGAPLTTGTALVLRGPFGGRRVGLALEGLLEQPFGENLLDRDDEVFDLREFGAPCGTVGPPNLIDEMFGDPVEVGPNFVHGGVGVSSECHPWHLLGVRVNDK